MKRNTLSLSEKVAIIHEIDAGKKQIEVSREKKISRSTINTIVKNRRVILQNYVQLHPDTKKVKACQFPKTEASLRQWFDQKRASNVTLNGSILLEQAKKFAQELGETNFKGTTGWLDKWKKRHAVKFYTLKGESASVDDRVVESWLENIWPPIRATYGDNDIYNVDETALFYKLLPTKTLSRKGQNCAGGKLSKELITVMLGCNANGSDRLPPVVIGKYNNPRAFKHVEKGSLPVKYYFNRKAWMTSQIFSDWLRKFDLRMQREGQ